MHLRKYTNYSAAPFVTHVATPPHIQREYSLNEVQMVDETARHISEPYSFRRTPDVITLFRVAA